MRALSLICCLLMLASRVAGSAVHYNVTTKYWDWEFKKNKWAFIDKVAVERGRNSLITNIFYSLYGGGQASGEGGKLSKLLDVGCGEAVLSDFLMGAQRQQYFGIDISAEAIKNARKRRTSDYSPANPNSINPENLQVAGALDYKPPPGVSFGAIVFNEMLYYTDYGRVLEHYIPFLEQPSRPQHAGAATDGPFGALEGGVSGGQGGVIIISCWYGETNEAMKDGIFKEAHRLLEPVDSMELSGLSWNQAKPKAPRRKVSFHIEALRVRR